ncbi:hypothetical protein Acr_06g0011130 [Actinidia rufa]|uniref:Uncharacterized protein n=1 Tax=Actinidia rufa TaxID=165716 RepID=A0A7J0ERW4_9ERIC|nr:hypothetical protein Acr_06g0011130 [Actinidia rufa]
MTSPGFGVKLSLPHIFSGLLRNPFIARYGTDRGYPRPWLRDRVHGGGMTTMPSFLARKRRDRETKSPICIVVTPVDSTKSLPHLPLQLRWLDVSANHFNSSGALPNLYSETSPTFLKVLQAHTSLIISSQLSEEVDKLMYMNAYSRMKNDGACDSSPSHGYAVATFHPSATIIPLFAIDVVFGQP